MTGASLVLPVFDPSGLAALLPAGVVLEQAWIADAQTPLHRDEEVAVERALGRRRAEFTAGRHCARQALRRLGSEALAVPVAADRSPVWPAGVVGSICHDEALCAVAVAWGAGIAAIGIDFELLSHIGAELEPEICTTEERASWPCVALCRRRRLALSFVAKEAVYKAQYPLTRERLEFHDLFVTPTADGFVARLQRSGVGDLPVGQRFVGRWAEAGDRVAAAIVLRCDRAP